MLGSWRAGTEKHPLCRGHHKQWNRWLKTVGKPSNTRSWGDWLEVVCDGTSVSSVARRGRLSLAKLPLALQREIRYALHRHANDVRRTHWRPTELQKVVDHELLIIVNNYPVRDFYADFLKHHGWIIFV